MKILKRILVLTTIVLLLFQVPFSCAQRGRPTGGPKDTIPPVFVNAVPPNYTTQFTHKTIRINFDEYIKLDEPNKQILISPPMQTKPIIEPMGQASRYVDIEILDTLKPNTTYTINFGQSIVDNNEGNSLPFFKYVFSTGKELDSLHVSGVVTDAYNRETAPLISVMLYSLDSTYTDSIIYKTPPTYVAYTHDSTNVFSVENVKAGRYKIVAIKDKSRNYVFNPGQDKVGFLTDTIQLPTDKQYNLRIFKETPEYDVERPKQLSATHLLFGFEGNTDSVHIHLLSSKPEGYAALYHKREESDSIDYWFKPAIKADSLLFLVRNQSVQDTVMVTLLEKMEKKDSLQIKATPTGTLDMVGEFSVSGTIPLTAIDTSRIQILDKDSAQVLFTTHYQPVGNRYVFDFKKQTEQTYAIRLLPGALTDFYGAQNDTLQYRLQTKKEADYANVRLTFQNVHQYPIIVQLVNEKGETQRELIHHKKEGAVFEFKYVDPSSYYVRVIYDTNDNGIWDTGNYLKKQQPERVLYMSGPLEVRQNWEISQTYTLEN